jgi:hypothetical protein
MEKKGSFVSRMRDIMAANRPAKLDDSSKELHHEEKTVFLPRFY